MEFCEQAKKLCRLGATDKELADFFGVSEQTINAWKAKHPVFLESLKEGKLLSDSRVANALFSRAIGYSHPEDKILNDNGSPMVVPTIKHYPPDPTACIFWLKNRRPDSWREKPDQYGSDDNAEPVKVVFQEKDCRVAGNNA